MLSLIGLKNNSGEGIERRERQGIATDCTEGTFFHDFVNWLCTGSPLLHRTVAQSRIVVGRVLQLLFRCRRRCDTSACPHAGGSLRS